MGTRKYVCEDMEIDVSTILYRALSMKLRKNLLANLKIMVYSRQ